MSENGARYGYTICPCGRDHRLGDVCPRPARATSDPVLALFAVVCYLAVCAMGAALFMGWFG